MKFGISVSNVGNLGQSVGVQGCIEIGEAADALGYHSLVMGDHVVLPAQIGYDDAHTDRRGATRWQYPVYEPLTLLNALAVRTKHVILHQGVLIIPLRHPVVLAKMLATTDHLSGGRLALGAGLGWMEEEFAALNLPPEYFPRRGAVTNEYLRAIKELWTSTGPSSFHGEFVNFENVGAYPKPLQKPHPPIVIGGHSRAAMRRAVRLGQGFDCTGDTIEELTERIAEFRRICLAEGRDPEEIEVSKNWLLSSTGAHGLRFQLNGRRDGERQLGSGTPDEIVSDMRQFAKAGVRHFMTLPRVEGREPAFERIMRGIQLMADEILPAFA